MEYLDDGTTRSLTIKEGSSLKIGATSINVVSYLGQLAGDIHHFKVSVNHPETEEAKKKIYLFRVGPAKGLLKREIEVRDQLKDYKMISNLLICETFAGSQIKLKLSPEEQIEGSSDNFVEDKPRKSDDTASAVTNSTPEASKIEHAYTVCQDKESPGQSSVLTSSPDVQETLLEKDETISASENDLPGQNEEKQELSENSELLLLTHEEIVLAQNVQLEPEIKIDQNQDSESTIQKLDFLEEEIYEVDSLNLVGDYLLVLSDYLNEDENLEMWLQSEHSISEKLSIVIQICQFLRLLHQKGWCLVDIEPRVIQVARPLKFYELSGIYPVGETLTHGLVGRYCAPELAYNQISINEFMACYSLGALFYQSIHKRLPSQNTENTLEIERIPQVYQMLKICLAQNPKKRFSLSQLLDVLINTRQAIGITKVSWEIASGSTVGLSTSRLQNEDNFGIRQQQLSNSEILLIGIVADGMGGMAEGEIASKLAVITVLDEPIPKQLKIGQECAIWLEEVFQKANQSIASTVRDGGTTLSLTLAINRDLMIAHVGDSRIYLIRNKNIYRLSEDHSLVEMLVASGQITEEEKDSHPDRNVLTKSLGSNRRLNNGYVQLVNHFNKELHLLLEMNDIILLCSDGVWDLVQETELVSMFDQHKVLQDYVDSVIRVVLDRGAQDNATLLALKLVS